MPRAFARLYAAVPLALLALECCCRESTRLILPYAKPRRTSLAWPDPHGTGWYWARALGLLVEEGDATDERILRAAGLERCSALIACTDSYATNTFITLAAKGLRPDCRDEKGFEQCLEHAPAAAFGESPPEAT